jgi:hypothetical protein
MGRKTMIRPYSRRVNYDHVCIECGFHQRERKSGADLCTRPVNLVTGDPLPVRCVTARSMEGTCGPEGRHFSARNTVRRMAAE